MEQEKKKRGRPPKKKEVKEGGEQSQVTVQTTTNSDDWTKKIMGAVVNNAFGIPRSMIESGEDEDAKTVGTIILSAMVDANNWVKRSGEDKYDFIIRFSIDDNERK